MKATFKSGDKVIWGFSSGGVHGEAIRKVSEETHIKSYVVKASKNERQCEVESDQTGAHTFYKAET